MNKTMSKPRIPQQTIDKAIAMRRDDHALLREIVEETGISEAHLKTIFRREDIRVPYRRKRGTPRPQKHKSKKLSGPQQSMAQRAVRPKKKKAESKPGEPRRKGDISPVLAMNIEDRMRRRREEREEAERSA